MTKEYKVQIMLYDRDEWQDLFKGDWWGTPVNPFPTMEMAKMFGEIYVKEHLKKYNKLFFEGNRFAKDYHVRKMRIVARELPEWKEIENADCTVWDHL